MLLCSRHESYLAKAASLPDAEDQSMMGRFVRVERQVRVRTAKWSSTFQMHKTWNISTWTKKDSLLRGISSGQHVLLVQFLSWRPRCASEGSCLPHLNANGVERTSQRWFADHRTSIYINIVSYKRYFRSSRCDQWSRYQRPSYFCVTHKVVLLTNWKAHSADWTNWKK